MPKKSLCLPLFSFVLLSLTAQSNMKRAVLELDPTVSSNISSSKIHSIPLQKIEPFLSFFITWQGETEEFQVRFSSDSLHWSEWQTLNRDQHNQEKKITEFFITKADYQFFQLKYNSQEVDHLKTHFFSPGLTPEISTPTKNKNNIQTQNCEQPTVIGRQQWCPNGNCPKGSSPQFTEVSHLIVHHSAGTNDANDWAAIVRAIYDLHVIGNGWADIGYNYLVDPDGVVYEGRGEDVLGAHFCSRNSGTMGVCVMGNFQNVTPTDEAVSGLVDLLNWKAFKEDIDPNARRLHSSTGLNLLGLSGHREGCATACPGDEFFPSFFSLRNRVRDSLNACALVTDIDEPISYGSIEIFPNPVQSELNIYWSSPDKGMGQIAIFTIDGKKLKSFNFDKFSEHWNFQLDLTDLNPGSYFLRIMIEGYPIPHYQKFIK